MSDENPDQQPGSHNWRQLEQSRDAALARATELEGLLGSAREQLIASAVQIAGFTPNDKGEYEGVTGLLVKEFRGSLGDTDLPNPAAFAQLAEQYGVKPASAPAPADQPPATPSLQDQINALQQPGEALAAAGSAPTPPASDIDAQMQAAHERGDVRTVLALQTQKLSGQ